MWLFVLCQEHSTDINYQCEVHWVSILTSPLAPGWNLSPGGNVNPFVYSQGWTLSTYSIEEWGANREFLSQGTKFTPGGQISTWGQSLPLGAK
jgi:hypothetical protein